MTHTCTHVCELYISERSNNRNVAILKYGNRYMKNVSPLSIVKVQCILVSELVTNYWGITQILLYDWMTAPLTAIQTVRLSERQCRVD